jgi:hypothetical protein
MALSDEDPMATAVQLDHTYDTTSVPVIVRGSLILGAVQSVIVLLVSLSNRSLTGTPDVIVTGVLVFLGVAATVLLPGIWTRARTIEGIAGAGGIGLGAALTYMLIDVILLQRLGTYTNRWWEVGGMSNWWYHPVWWMVGAFLAWLGGWVLANQATRRGAASPVAALLLIAALVAVIGSLAAVLHFPGAQWHVATFAVAVMPALIVATIWTGLGTARR